MERQSSDTRKLLENLNTSTFATPLRKNDDESERNRRRSHVAKSTPATKESPVLTNALHLNQKQLLDALNKIQKMYAENKITKRNVWELHVVEYMRRYVGMQSSAGNMDMLKFASSALDVSSKVYGLRVDSVYETSMKLASRINRMYAQRDVSDATADSEDDDKCANAEVGKNKNKKKLKRKVAPKSTITTDDSELFGAFPQIVSSMFNTEMHIKNSNTENLLSNRLYLSKTGTIMNLWIDECAFRRESDIDRLVCEPFVNKTFAVNLPSKSLPTICPQLRSFVIDEWDPEQEEVAYHTLQEVIYDVNGFPVPESDATTEVNNDFENGGGIYIDSDDDENVLTSEMALNRQVAFVVDFHPDSSNMLQVVNEYSYLSNVGNTNRQLSQIWAGPSHWKLKTLKHSVARYTGKQDDKQNNKLSRRKRQAVEDISFSDDTFDDFLKDNNTLKNCRAMPQLVQKQCLVMPLLKADILMLDRQLAEFQSVTKCFKRKPKEEIRDEAADNRNNLLHGLDDNDSSQMSSQNNVTEADDMNPNYSLNFLPNNLIDKPNMVKLSKIFYQTHPTKIDMRKLKRAIWECLTNTSQNDQAPIIMTQPVRFSYLLEQVPAKLSAQTRSELTCQTVFVALLHLCNEHCLRLDNSGDIVISQA